MTQALFDKYYYHKPSFVNGTVRFLQMCREQIPAGAEILEIGAGPGNDCSEAFSGMGTVTGLDVDPDVKTNQWLSRAFVYDGKQMPFPDASFDACVSNFVIEHVEHPSEHFAEVARVLRPGGVYCLRTPNLFHYVCMVAYLLPHSLHLPWQTGCGPSPTRRTIPIGLGTAAIRADGCGNCAGWPVSATRRLR